jgi:hypothetical protein
VQGADNEIAISHKKTSQERPGWFLFFYHASGI